MQKLKKSELKKHLINSVKILKHSLKQPDYSYLILATLFLYHAENAAFRHRGTAVPKRIVPLPPTELRLNFQHKQKHLQAELAHAFSTLEDLHPPLRGVLLAAISETPIPDTEMLAFREQLDNLQKNTHVFSNSENFSRAFEYWISLLAEMTVKRGVAFYTPRSLASLMVGITKPREGMRIYDPTAGTGGMLIGAAQYIRQHGGSLESTEFYGREKSPDIWAICMMNLIAHQIDNASIERGDTLENIRDQTGIFDIILQNLPLPSDPGNRTKSNQTNRAFLEHAVESLSPSGRAAILAPAFILQQDHQVFWETIIRHDWLEAVIYLPFRLLHGTHTSACLFIFNKQKSSERNAQVLLIRVQSNFLTHTRHNELQAEEIQTILQALDTWGKTYPHARVVSTQQFERQNYSLSMERYPDWDDNIQPFDLVSALNLYRLAAQRREAAVTHLIQTLAEFDYPAIPGQPQSPLE